MKTKNQHPFFNKQTLKRYLPNFIIGITAGVLNGLFGAGGGCIVVPACEKFLKMDEKKAHATAILVILILSSLSTLIYLKDKNFDLSLWLPATAGGLIGGGLGAVLLNKIPVSLLKIIFGVVIISTALKMIF